MIQDVTAVLGAIIAIIGFFAVIIQLRQVEKGLRSTARGSIYDMASRIKEVFLAHPELRPYFYNNVQLEEIDQASYDKAIVVADYFCLYLEQIITQGETISKHSRTSWFKYTKSVYDRSPLIREYLKDKREWYPPIFWDVLEGRVTCD